MRKATPPPTVRVSRPTKKALAIELLQSTYSCECDHCIARTVAIINRHLGSNRPSAKKERT
jgi:hypothetical protein